MNVSLFIIMNIYTHTRGFYGRGRDCALRRSEPAHGPAESVVAVRGRGHAAARGAAAVRGGAAGGGGGGAGTGGPARAVGSGHRPRRGEGARAAAGAGGGPGGA